MEQILEKILESVPKARILRVFMRNPDAFFILDDLVKMTKIRKTAVRLEIAKLMKLDIIRKKTVSIEISDKKKKKPRIKKAEVYYVNAEFGIFEELRALVQKGSLVSHNTLLRKLKGLGRLKLAVISGVFIGNDTARTDLLVVGDSVTKRKMENFIKSVESEIGKTLRYTVMESPEFKYRMDMYDRFLRDILEYPHEKLINRINL